MNKKRNVRKKLDDESDESDRPEISMTKRPKSSLPTFSFDEENEGATFTVKKSKQSKQLKKTINQAPNTLQFVDNKDSYLLASSGCSYTEKSLQELRESQQFSAYPHVDETGETVVINGELLETLDEIETSEWPSTLSELTPTPISPVEISSTQNNDENEQIWEDQLATRGGIKLNHLSSFRESNDAKNGTFHRNSSVTSIRQSIIQNLQSAKDSCVKQNKQIELTRVSLSSLNDEKSSSEELLKVKTSDLLFLKEFRLYVSDVVGMLRAKEPLVNDLQKAILQGIRPYNQSLEAAPIDPGIYQESLEQDSNRFKEAAAVIMQDVRFEISQVSEVLASFHHFRQRNLPKYQATYIDLSLPKLIGPFVILDILPCFVDLVKGKILQFSDRPWYTPLYDYSIETVPGVTSSNTKELLPNVILEIVLPLLTSSIGILFNPFDQKSVSNLSQIILQIIDFDPTPNQLASLFDEIVVKFERTLELKSRSPLQLQNLLESLKVASQFLSPRKVSHLACKSLDQYRSILLESLSFSDETSLLMQISAYNMVVLILKTLMQLLQKCVPLIGNDALDDCALLFSAMKSLVLEQFDPPPEDAARHLSLLQFRRSSLVLLLSKSATK